MYEVICMLECMNDKITNPFSFDLKHCVLNFSLIRFNILHTNFISAHFSPRSSCLSLFRYYKMEVGAVKHHLNNEIIHIKKKMNQAKVQLIHKLTRKAKTLKSQKKTPEHLKAKIQRKADAAVAEVLLMKKVKAKDLVRFAITHKGTLQEYLNTPTVSEEKVFAKILLNKVMTDKYNSIREKFANMPVDELLLTRKERLRLKKERNETSKKEKQSKGDSQKETSDGDEIKSAGNEDEEMLSDESINDEPENDFINSSDEEEQEKSENESDEDLNAVEMNKSQTIQKELKQKTVPEMKKKVKQKMKKSNKKRTTDAIESAPVQVVDSFFLTTSGDQYMTLAEPRAPDEVKEEHNRGNRRMRRAEKFGKPIKYMKPRNDFRTDGKSKYEKPVFSKKRDSFDSSFGKNFNSSKMVSSKSIDGGKSDVKEEKLHPSWEAKKQKSGIVAFQGKKVVF